MVEHASKVEVDLSGGLRALHGLRSLDLAVERSGGAVKTTGEEREAVIVQAINGEVRSRAREKIDRSVFKHPGQSQPRSDKKSVGISQGDPKVKARVHEPDIVRHSPATVEQHS